MVQGLGRAPRVTALALSPNALAFAAVGPGAGGAGCRLRIALLPSDAGDAAARDARGEEPAAAFGSIYGDRRDPHPVLAMCAIVSLWCMRELSGWRVMEAYLAGRAISGLLCGRALGYIGCLAAYRESARLGKFSHEKHCKEGWAVLELGPLCYGLGHACCAA